VRIANNEDISSRGTANSIPRDEDSRALEICGEGREGYRNAPFVSELGCQWYIRQTDGAAGDLKRPAKMCHFDRRPVILPAKLSTQRGLKLAQAIGKKDSP